MSLSEFIDRLLELEKMIGPDLPIHIISLNNKGEIDLKKDIDIAVGCGSKQNELRNVLIGETSTLVWLNNDDLTEQ